MFKYQDKASAGRDKILALIATLAILISVAAFVGGLFGGYFFDSFKAVAGNEHSVPAPRTR